MYGGIKINYYVAVSVSLQHNASLIGVSVTERNGGKMHSSRFYGRAVTAGFAVHGKKEQNCLPKRHLTTERRQDGSGITAT